MEQLTKEEAIETAKNIDFTNWSIKDIVFFQVNQKLLCMDFSLYHESCEKLLERPIFTHEFASESLISELKLKSK